MRRGLKARTEQHNIGEPELLPDFNRQPLPVVSFRDQIVQLGLIVGLLSLACLAWRYLP